MKELQIKIQISDREYSLRIDPKDEAILRKAGKAVNEKIKDRRDRLGVYDKQDLLAMIAFDLVVDNLKNRAQESQLELKLQGLNTLLDNLES